MVVKSTKLPSALDALIRRAAAANRSSSALMRDAIVRGLEKSEAIDMCGALAGFLGALEGLRDLSMNKNYVRAIVPKRAR